MNGTDFVCRIEKLLEMQKKTKVEFSNSIGIPKQSLYDWKQRGTIPSADTALKIAQYLNTTVEYLLTGKETDENKVKLDGITEEIQNIINKYRG